MRSAKLKLKEKNKAKFSRLRHRLGLSEKDSIALKSTTRTKLNEKSDPKQRKQS